MKECEETLTIAWPCLVLHEIEEGSSKEIWSRTVLLQHIFVENARVSSYESSFDWLLE
jgi:hypothetical protein